jgi:hypothetical protein
MKKTISQILRIATYKPLLEFANETLTKENWKAALHGLDEWELSWGAGMDTEQDTGRIGSINGSTATFDRALGLQEHLRRDLSKLAGHPSDDPRRVMETGAAKTLKWRKALVLPTGERFIEDHGERFGFLVEGLEHELGQSAREAGLPGEVSDDRPQLHLGICGCGCGTFFLWDGNWDRKQRKFLNDHHRMNYHNRRNVKQKRELARLKRKQGDLKYF